MSLLPQLQRCKRLLSVAKSQWHINDAFASGIAVSLAQDAVELLAWTIVKEKNLGVSEKEHFHGLLSKIEGGTNQSIPYKAKLTELNTSRVGFKHHGILPVPGEALKLLGYAEDFIREITRQFFDLDFESLSMADLIESKIIRDEIKQAEIRLSDGDYKTCVEHCGKADYLIGEPLQHLLPEIGVFDLSLGTKLFPDRDKAHVLDRGLEAVRRHINSLRIVSLAALLKIDPRTFVQYMAVVPMTDFMGNQTIEVFHRKKQYSQEEAELCLECVTTIAIRAQELGIVDHGQISEED